MLHDIPRLHSQDMSFSLAAKTVIISVVPCERLSRGHRAPRRYRLLVVGSIHRRGVELVVVVSGMHATVGPRSIGNSARPEARVCAAYACHDGLAVAVPGLRLLARVHDSVHA